MSKKKFNEVALDSLAAKIEWRLQKKYKMPHLCVSHEIIPMLNCDPVVKIFLTDLDNIRVHVPDDLVTDAAEMLRDYYGENVIFSIVQPSSHQWDIPKIKP